jgi:hypothetical protein
VATRRTARWLDYEDSQEKRAPYIEAEYHDAAAKSARTHIPIFNDENSGNAPENAVFIDDASISHAVYHEVTENSPRLRETFDLDALVQRFLHPPG